MKNVLRFQVAASLVFSFCIAAALAAPAQSFRSLVDFFGNNGADPLGALVQGFDGNLYGTTWAGGANSGGTLFKVAQNGELKTIYNFCALNGCPDGYGPESSVILSTDGSFYGVTQAGGPSTSCGLFGCGVVFRITPDSKLTTLYTFCTQADCPDGSSPIARLIQATDGNFYGTSSCYSNCSAPYGVLFRITPEGVFTILHTFAGPPNDAGYFAGPLIQGPDGNLYGTSWGGGADTYGTVFKTTLSGQLTVLYSFCSKSNCTDGAGPRGGLVQTADGYFYS